MLADITQVLPGQIFTERSGDHSFLFQFFLRNIGPGHHVKDQLLHINDRRNEVCINITDGAEANFESDTCLGGEGTATITVDEASKVSGSENAWMYLYDNGKFINEGKMEMNLYVNGGELTAVGGKEQRVGGLIGTVYAKEAEYKFDQCITVGAIVSACFKFANAEEILAYCTENADPSSILLARYNVESLMKPSELQIAGFNPAKGLAEPEPEVTEPVVTEPVVTEPVPEETKPADPVPTGDSALIFAVVAIIALLGVATVAKRREN